jgi:hypothetical protein
VGTPSRLLHCGRVKKRKKVLARWCGGEAVEKRPGLVGARFYVSVPTTLTKPVVCPHKVKLL